MLIAPPTVAAEIRKACSACPPPPRGPDVGAHRRPRLRERLVRRRRGRDVGGERPPSGRGDGGGSGEDASGEVAEHGGWLGGLGSLGSQGRRDGTGEGEEVLWRDEFWLLLSLFFLSLGCISFYLDKLHSSLLKYLTCTLAFPFVSKYHCAPLSSIINLY